MSSCEHTLNTLRYADRYWLTTFNPQTVLVTYNQLFVGLYGKQIVLTLLWMNEWNRVKELPSNGPMPQAAPLPNILERSESKKSESDTPSDSKSSDLALLCSHNDVSMLKECYIVCTVDIQPKTCIS